MSVKVATNQFSNGLICDYNEYLVQQDKTLTNALNATFISNIGEMGAIQNDMGNLEIPDELKDGSVKLSDGFQPIGIKEHNGIIYIASINEKGECEIGSYPSPNYKKIEAQSLDAIEVKEQEVNLVESYQPLMNCVNTDVDGQKKLYYTSQMDQGGVQIKPCRTVLFNWDINHPVDIQIQPSYDGSVNLLINDNKNIPRLINTRFSVTSSGKAKIPNRMKNNANLYRIIPKLENEQEFDQDKFDIDTSLIKRVNKFPIIDYEGQLENGNLNVGNYVFYIKYCDYDKNETDWVAESGIISVFKGTDADPFTINGGIENENANKTIQLKLNNFDTSYDFIKVYYTKSSSQANIEPVPEAYEIIDPIFVSDDCIISITGNEDKKQIGLDYIQTSYSTIEYAKTQAQIQNRMFFANIKEPDLLYKDLTDISLHINPYVNKIKSKDKIGHISQKDYSEDSEIKESTEKHIFKGEYYNTKNIYYNVGYWNEEYYRLGIVYINKDGSNSPVFNLPGGEITGFTDNKNTVYLHTVMLKNECPSIFAQSTKSRQSFIIDGNYIQKTKINTKGVIHINDKQISYTNDDYIYSLGVQISPEIQNYLFELGIKGFFIVRKKRIKTILAQGFTMPWDKESHLPVVEYWAKSFPYVNGGSKMAGFELNKNSLSYVLNNKDNNDTVSIAGSFSKYIENVGGYNSKSDKKMMWFPHYFVESFLTQTGQDTRDWRKTGDSTKDGSVVGESYLLTRCLTNSYLPRLHNILPCCIDEKMVDWQSTDKDWLYRQYNLKGYFVLTKDPNVAFQPDFINTTFTDFESAFEYLLMGLGDQDQNPNYFTELRFRLFNNLSETSTSVQLIDTANLVAYLKKFEAIDFTCKNNLTILQQLQYAIKVDSFNYQYNFKFGDNDNEKVYSDFNDIIYDYVKQLGESDNKEYTINFKLNVKVLNQNNTIIESFEEFINNQFYNKNYGELSYKGEKPQYTTQQKGAPDSGYAYSSNTDYYYTPQLCLREDGSIPIFPNDSTNKYLANELYESKCYYSSYIITNGKEKGPEKEKPQYFYMHWYNRYKYCDGNQLTAICPEFEVNQTDFNQFFTGQELSIKYTAFQQGMPIRDTENERHYYPYYKYSEDRKENSGKVYEYDNDYLNKELKYKIIGVTENLPTVGIDHTIFTSLAGNAQEAYRTSFINEQHSAERGNMNGEDFNSKNDQDFNFVRGIYSPYLGIVAKQYNNSSEKDRGYSYTFNIYAKGTQFWDENGEDPNLLIRFNDNSPYYPISNRIEFNDKGENIEQDIFRGDCFLCTFTHRVNRNFQDSTAPTNDVILYPETWEKHYKGDGSENDKIQRGDINAVKLGSWITIKIKSTNNLSIRTVDESNRDEMAIFGHGRRFYPIEPISAEGGTKIATSYISNNGFKTNLGLKRFVGYKDSAYIRNEFKNRIIYSDVNTTDSFINGYRVFKTGNYQDYSKQYGEITKLIPLGNNLVCIMEHGVGLIPINERALVANGDGGEVFINNKTILPENIVMINESYGCQWPEAVISTPYFIFGLDASERKIWTTDGTKLQIISDNKISKFLQENISFKENEVDINIINSNIKTTYNAKKNDVMFTVWNTKENKIWNVCYNITFGNFSTFYSWIPSYSVNIDNTMYSFEYHIPKDNKDFWDHDNHIWKHGNLKDQYVKPTNWYGNTYPFEFEFIVNDSIYLQKIFQNLKIIANNVEPESFHFTVSGDAYSFKDDLKNIYYRQEATRDLMNGLGSNIEYDKQYSNTELDQQKKSVKFTEYYKKEKPIYYMYEIYKQLTGDGKNYDNLSGTEVVKNKLTDHYEISTHIKNTSIEKDNRLRGNSQYKENEWHIQIPSINFREKNEDKWKVPPIVLPKSSDNYDIKSTNINKLPAGYRFSDIDTEDSWSDREEAKIRDKYIKIKIRYNGNKLATIYSILTMFQLSTS